MLAKRHGSPDLLAHCIFQDKTRACEPTDVHSSILASHTESHWSSSATLLDVVEFIDKTTARRSLHRLIGRSHFHLAPSRPEHDRVTHQLNVTVAHQHSLHHLRTAPADPPTNIICTLCGAGRAGESIFRRYFHVSKKSRSVQSSMPLNHRCVKTSAPTVEHFKSLTYCRMGLPQQNDVAKRHDFEKHGTCIWRP